VVDLDSFGDWAYSKDFPRQGQVSFLGGQVWVDTTMEELFSHNQVKGAFAITLGNLVNAAQNGWYFYDRAFLTKAASQLSTEPDGIFVAAASVQAGRVRFIERAPHSYLELAGTPEMVLEVVSESSVDKDTVVLRELYYNAGVQEYWLVDARRDVPRFDILHRGRRDYSRTRPQGGWLRSGVLNRCFRLVRQPGLLGYPKYVVEIQNA
jgi:Uma2 family endonuclease